jgi:hypothetical protein
MPPTSSPIIVRWRDCFTSQDTWKGAEEPPDDPVIVTSVGWEIQGYKEGYVVITDAWFERDGDVYYGTLHYIPDGMEVSRSSLGWTKP